MDGDGGGAAPGPGRLLTWTRERVLHPSRRRGSQSQSCVAVFDCQRSPRFQGQSSSHRYFEGGGVLEHSPERGGPRRPAGPSWPASGTSLGSIAFQNGDISVQVGPASVPLGVFCPRQEVDASDGPAGRAESDVDSTSDGPGISASGFCRPSVPCGGP